jgi:hypothetical protein
MLAIFPSPAGCRTGCGTQLRIFDRLESNPLAILRNPSDTRRHYFPSPSARDFAMPPAQVCQQLIYSHQRQHSLQNCAEADEDYKQLQELSQSAIIGKFVDRPKQMAPITTIIKTPINTEIIKIPFAVHEHARSWRGNRLRESAPKGLGVTVIVV